MRAFSPDEEVHVDLGTHRTVAAAVGAQGGPVLCCLHALALDRHAFAALADGLQLHGRTVAFDQRGHGQADAPASSIALETMARDVWAVLDALNVDQAHLLGHSLGGAIAAMAAAIAPARCASLTLVATPATGGEVFARRAAAAEREGIEAMTAPTLARWFTSDGDASPDVRHYARQCLTRMPVVYWAAAWRALSRFAGYAELGPRLPATLCVSAVDDVSTTPAAMDRIASQIPKVVAHRSVPRAGHMLPLEQPQVVAQLITEHVLTQPGEQPIDSKRT